MDKSKSQHYSFTHEAIPVLWHKESAHFLEYLAKDGKSFLRFYWNHIKENLGATIGSSSEGLEFAVKEVNNKDNKPVKIVILTLPQPKNIGEVYFMALVKLPDKKTFMDLFLIHLPTTRVFSLELSGYDESNSPNVKLFENTPRGRSVFVREGSAPQFSDFYNSILKELSLERNSYANL